MTSLPRGTLPIALLLVGAGGFAALTYSRTEPLPPAVDEKVWTIDVEPVNPGSYAPILRLLGRIDSPRVARLSAALSSDVVEVSALDGQRVAKGEPLVELDARDATLALRERDADVADIRAQIKNEEQRHASNLRALKHERELLALANAGVQRANDLLRRDLGARANLDEARQAQEHQAMALERRELAISEYDAKRAQLAARLLRAEALRDRAALDLERTRISAPFDGVVAEVFVSQGDRVERGSRLLSFYDSASAEIRAQVPSRYVQMVREALRLGDAPRAIAEVDGLQISARLHRVAAQVASGSGGVECVFKVEGQSAPLTLGRTVLLSVSMPPVDGIFSVPYEALYANQRVYVVEADRLRAIDVERLGETLTASGSTRALIRGELLGTHNELLITQLPNAAEGLRVARADKPPSRVE